MWIGTEQEAENIVLAKAKPKKLSVSSSSSSVCIPSSSSSSTMAVSMNSSQSDPTCSLNQTMENEKGVPFRPPLLKRSFGQYFEPSVLCFLDDSCSLESDSSVSLSSSDEEEEDVLNGMTSTKPNPRTSIVTSPVATKTKRKLSEGNCEQMKQEMDYYDLSSAVSSSNFKKTKNI